MFEVEHRRVEDDARDIAGEWRFEQEGHDNATAHAHPLDDYPLRALRFGVGDCGFEIAPLVFAIGKAAVYCPGSAFVASHGRDENREPHIHHRGQHAECVSTRHAVAVQEHEPRVPFAGDVPGGIAPEVAVNVHFLEVDAQPLARVTLVDPRINVDECPGAR